MNPPEEPEGSELLQVATNCVLRDAQPRHELGHHNSPVAAKPSEDLPFPLCCQHRCGL
jgi:hypothetical protein